MGQAMDTIGPCPTVLVWIVPVFSSPKPNNKNIQWKNNIQIVHKSPHIILYYIKELRFMNMITV
jgi:hypothetical protein